MIPRIPSTLLLVLVCSLVFVVAAEEPPEAGTPQEEMTGPPTPPNVESMQRLVAASAAIRDDFFDPQAHATLARAYHGVGARVMAYRVLFNARRYFPAADLVPAVHEVFRDAETAAAARKRLSRSHDKRVAAAREALETQPEEPAAVLELGRLLSRRDDTCPEAVELLERARTLAPEDEHIVTALSTALRRSGQPGAEDLLRDFLETHPESAAVRLELADVMQSKGSTGRAWVLLKEGLEVTPDDARLHLGLGWISPRAGVNDLAVGHFRRAAELDPTNAKIFAWWGTTLMSQAGEQSEEDRAVRERALELYLRAYFLDPLVQDSVPVYKRITAILEELAAMRLAEVSSEPEALTLFVTNNPQLTLGSWSLAHVNAKPTEALLHVAQRQLAHDDEAVRLQAARYLSRHAPGIDEKMDLLLGHEDPFVRGAACFILVGRRGAAGEAEITGALNDSNAHVQFMAHAALRQLGGDWGRELSQTYLNATADEQLRQVFQRMER